MQNNIIYLLQLDVIKQLSLNIQSIQNQQNKLNVLNQDLRYFVYTVIGKLLNNININKYKR